MSHFRSEAQDEREANIYFLFFLNDAWYSRTILVYVKKKKKDSLWHQFSTWWEIFASIERKNEKIWFGLEVHLSALRCVCMTFNKAIPCLLIRSRRGYRREGGGESHRCWRTVWTGGNSMFFEAKYLKFHHRKRSSNVKCMHVASKKALFDSRNSFKQPQPELSKATGFYNASLALNTHPDLLSTLTMPRSCCTRLCLSSFLFHSYL